MNAREDRLAGAIGTVALATLGSALLWLRWSAREPALVERTKRRLA